ncbi:MAG TPA: tandem-95 repeat protein, partial [Verrucomicrobiae bacterium]
GAQNQGGNWTLEFNTGSRQAASPFVTGFNYEHVLPAKRIVDPQNNYIFVRPGGNSWVWAFGNGTGPTSTPTPVSTITYWNVPANNAVLTRGSYQYSSNGGATWTTYLITTNPTYMAVSGTIWRFVDNAPNDTTNGNSLWTAWQLQGFPNSTTSTGTGVIPDNPPTDITISQTNMLNTSPAGKTVATLTPVDTGSTTSGRWVLDSQSVPNLFVLTNDSTTGNTAALNVGASGLSSVSAPVTVTAHYYDLYQTDTNGNPIAGQGIAKTFTLNVVPEATTNLNFTADLPVNTYTTDDQSAQAMTTLSDGSAVVVWQSGGQGGKANNTYYGIYGQRLSNTGAKIGSEYLISNAGSSIQEQYPAITPLANGRYAVAYLTTSPNTNANVGLRIVESNGVVGSQIIVNTIHTNNQANISMATLTSGNFVVVWASDIGDVYLQQYTTNGATVGSPVTFALAAGYYPAVAALDNGSYVVEWQDYNTGNAKLKVGPSGTVVDTGIVGSYGPPHLATLTNGFVLVVDAYDSVNSVYVVQGAIYNNSNIRQGSVFQVNASSHGNAFYSTLAPTSDGGFVALWQNDYDDYDLDGIFGRRFTATGTAVDTNNFEVNQHRTGDQVLPSVAALPNNTFIGAWTAYPSGTYVGDIYARVLLASVVNTAPVFVGSTTTLVVGENSGATDLKTLFHVNDADASQTETWTVSTAPNHGTLTITSATAASGSTDITPGGTMTYAPAANYFGSDSFAVQVSDGAGGTAIRTITVTVNPPPGITSSLTVQGTNSFAFSYNITASNSPTGFGASGLPSGLSVNTGSGLISGTPTAPGVYAVNLSATNTYGVGTAVLSLTIFNTNLPPVFIGANTNLLVAENSGAADLKSLLHVSDTDTNQTETWSQNTGPAHGTLTISGATASSGSADITPGGTLTYTPATNFIGADSFIMQVSDGKGGTALRTILVTVNPPPGITSALAATGTNGSAFSYTITASNSPTSFGASGLPLGLGVNTVNGLISGTPTTFGSFNVTISATNAYGVGSATLVLSLANTNLPPVFLGGTNLVIAENASATDIKSLLHVSDTDTNQTETWAQNTAPAHGTLSISGATASSGSADITPGGTLTYTPDASYFGTDTFIIQVSDSSGGSALRTIFVTVNPPPGITSALTAQGTNSLAFSYNITASNSPTGYGASGLPSGLSVNTGNGLISGTPTAPGVYAVNLSATNAYGVGTAVLSLTIFNTNLPPAFIGANTNLVVAENSGATDLKSLVHVSDTDTNQT